MVQINWRACNPVRSFPTYSGPYSVGTCDVELPVDKLQSPAPTPDESIGTVSFRIYYPCEPNTSSDRPVKWLPRPQSQYVSALARWAGAAPTIGNILAWFPQFLYLARLPASRNANLLQREDGERWPVMVFSHGLVGFRNAYSHICGLLASHGVCVIAPDHRDQSSPITFVRETDAAPAKTIYYHKICHEPTTEVFQARDKQLRIRMWELGCIFNALLKIDSGTSPRNLDPNFTRNGERSDVISMFQDSLDVKRPGSIIWAGHSFGAATIYQFLKSVYHPPPKAMPQGQYTLFNPNRESDLVKHITSRSVALPLDLFCLPLTSTHTKWLWDLPLPCYDTSSPNPAGGSAILTVLSEAFNSWLTNLHDTKQALSPHDSDPPNEHIPWKPHMFYVESSAHHSQSDFGIVFPLLSNQMYRAKEPRRILELNARAMLQTLRDNGFQVAPPTEMELKDVVDAPYTFPSLKRKRSGDETEFEMDKVAVNLPSLEDLDILKPEAGTIRGWHPINSLINHNEIDDGEASVMGEEMAKVQVDGSYIIDELEDFMSVAGDTEDQIILEDALIGDTEVPSPATSSLSTIGFDGNSNDGYDDDDLVFKKQRTNMIEPEPIQITAS